MNGIRLVLVVASALGLAASAALHAGELLHKPVQDAAIYGLLIGIALVWVPAVVELLAFRSALKSTAGWFLVVAGGPIWLLYLAPVVLFYAFVNFALASGQLTGTVTMDSPAFGRVATGHALAFYAMALTVLYPAYRRAARGMIWQCRAGHHLDHPDLQCPRCGAQVVAAIPTAQLGA